MFRGYLDYLIIFFRINDEETGSKKEEKINFKNKKSYFEEQDEIKKR